MLSRRSVSSPLRPGRRRPRRPDPRRRPRRRAEATAALVVTPTAREAEDLEAELRDLLDPAGVAVYPNWETLPHERLSPRSDTVGRRLAVLRRLCHPGVDAANGPLRVVVAPVRSVLQPQVKGLGDLEPVELAPGDTAPLDDLVRRLADAAYSRVDLVEKRGEFAVRGGIVDVFPPTEEHPLRVELWGDEVEEIRSFAVADQRTLEAVDRLWAPPCRELLLTRRGPRTRPRAGREPPPAARADRQDRCRHRRRGHGVARAGPRRRDGAARRPAARRHPRARGRPGAGGAPVPTTSSPPARSSSAPRGPRPPVGDRPRSTSVGRPTAASVTCGSTPSTGHCRGGR